MAMRMAAVSRAIAGSQGAKGRSRRLHKVPHVPRKALETRRMDRNASCAAFFGVGAPEAIVVGAVALLVFGPQGLAQAAKALGATLKSLAPTIRELQEVSTDFRSTLEKEIGMEEIGSFTSTSSFLANNAAKSSMESSRSFMDEKPMDDPLQFEADEEVEGAEKVEATDAEGREPTEQVGEMGEELSLDEMRKKSQEMAWNASNVEPTESEEQRLAEDEFSLEEIQAEIQRRKKLSALSLEELEAKLEHRKGNKEDDNTTNRTEM